MSGKDRKWLGNWDENRGIELKKTREDKEERQKKRKEKLGREGRERNKTQFATKYDNTLLISWEANCLQICAA